MLQKAIELDAPNKSKRVDFINVCLFGKELCCARPAWHQLCTNTATHLFLRWTGTDGETLCCKYASGHSLILHGSNVYFCCFSWSLFISCHIYLCYLCMTVHIYMIGFLSPVIDFGKLEINYQTSLWSVIYLQVFLYASIPPNVFYF